MNCFEIALFLEQSSRTRLFSDIFGLLIEMNAFCSSTGKDTTVQQDIDKLQADKN